MLDQSAADGRFRGLRADFGRFEGHRFGTVNVGDCVRYGIAKACFCGIIEWFPNAWKLPPRDVRRGQECRTVVEEG